MNEEQYKLVEEQIRQELINDFHSYVKKKYIQVEYDINEIDSNNSLVFNVKKYKEKKTTLIIKKEVIGEFLFYIEKYMKTKRGLNE